MTKYSLITLFLVVISVGIALLGHFWLAGTSTRDFNFGPPLLILFGSLGVVIGSGMLIVAMKKRE